MAVGAQRFLTSGLLNSTGKVPQPTATAAPAVSGSGWASVAAGPPPPVPQPASAGPQSAAQAFAGLDPLGGGAVVLASRGGASVVPRSVDGMGERGPATETLPSTRKTTRSCLHASL
jgi:hypothetical protein